MFTAVLPKTKNRGKRKIPSIVRPLSKLYTYSEFFWFSFFRIRTEYVDLLCKSLYIVRMKANADQKTPNVDTFYSVNML